MAYNKRKVKSLTETVVHLDNLLNSMSKFRSVTANDEMMFIWRNNPLLEDVYNRLNGSKEGYERELTNAIFE